MASTTPPVFSIEIWEILTIHKTYCSYNVKRIIPTILNMFRLKITQKDLLNRKNPLNFKHCLTRPHWKKLVVTANIITLYEIYFSCDFKQIICEFKFYYTSFGA